MNPIRVNILGLGLIGAALIGILAVATTGDAQLSTLAVAGTFVGGFAGVMVRLSEPDPDPSVPASVVERILSGTGDVGEAATAADGTAASPWRGNVIVLALIAAAVVLMMLFVLPGDAALVTVAGGVVGGLVSIAGKLVEPPPNPGVPASVVHRLIDGTPKDRPLGAS